MQTMMQIFMKFKAQILYLVFGVLTTVINIVLYAILRQLALPVQVAYWIAWFLTVLVAYLTNRVWVFNSQAKGVRELADEIVKFYIARLATGIAGSAILWFGTRVLHQNDMLWNIIQNVFVIVSNYVLSKWIIFKAKEKWER